MQLSVISNQLYLVFGLIFVMLNETDYTDCLMLVLSNQYTSSRPSSPNSRCWLQDCNFLILEMLEFNCDLDTKRSNSPSLTDVALSLAQNYCLSISHTWKISLSYILLSIFLSHLLEEICFSQNPMQTFHESLSAQLY